MVRARTSAAPTTPRRRPRATAQIPSLLETAERMVAQIEALVAELAGVRAENASLRAELRDAVVMMERASAALDGAAGRPAGARRRRKSADPEAGTPTARRGRPARGSAARPRRGRATPEGVTAPVVQAAIGHLGPSTAAEIAAYISRLGAPVSGRAVRFLAERAGATIEVGTDGQRRYRI